MNDTAARRTLHAVPVPDELHLAVDDRGHPATVPFDRGRSAVFAYTVPSDRPRDRGTTTRLARRRDLAADERSGRFAVQVDAAAGSGDGLRVTNDAGRARRFVPYATSAVRAIGLTGASGIWAQVVRRVSRPESAFMLLETGQFGDSVALVVDPDPESWVARAAAALGPRPHPEVVVVATLDSVPLLWRRAARSALQGSVTTAGQGSVTTAGQGSVMTAAPRDLTLAEARQRFVAETGDGNLRDLLWDRAHVETEDWWIVLYDSRAWYETGNPLLRLAGNAPFVVPKDGSPSFRLRTTTSIEAQLADVGQRVLGQFLS
ncbi:YrhB domain-containing protein [Curtobacterium sp. MCBA15_001]|uniref:YrhB domain-containing protein n=1 Tax=Curtobacterium sp. MCBA15_001 TaxID=1898731 RepID=UPI000A93F906|nr:YrhB domain-containing protein [Curtobacterium sp. MCBA15_001]